MSKLKVLHIIDDRSYWKIDDIYLFTHRSKLFLNATITPKWLHILDLYSALMTFDQGQGESLYRAALRNFSKHDPLWKLYQLCHSTVFCVYVTSLNLTETILLRNEKKILLLVCWLFLLDENKDYLETFNALFSPLHRLLKLKQKKKTFLTCVHCSNQDWTK